MKHRMYFELDEKQMKALTMGQELCVKVEGKVVGMRAGEKGGKRLPEFPPEVQLEVSSISIELENEYSKMAEEDD